MKIRAFPTLRRFTATLLCCVSAVYGAAAADDVAVQLTASKVAGEKLVAADQAKPGDVIQYDAVYRNTSKGAVSNLQATVPIPSGLEYLPESAKPAGATASLDGKEFSKLPLRRKGADGKEELVPAAEYRALRWPIAELKPGASATVTLRARVLTNQPVKPASN